MKNRPKVSVCIPVYNAEKFISECLDSLVKQTLREIEIICVNDGSTDSSPEIIKQYQKKYKNIKLINQKNQGLGGARNTGIENATGKYVGFVDADDFVDEEMYEALYRLAEEKGCEIAMCNLRFEPNAQTKKHLWYKPYKGVTDGEFLDRNIQPWNKIVARDLIERIDFKFFPKNGDDMFIVLMLEANNIVSTDERYYHYRIGHSTMSNTFKIDSFLNFIKCTEAQIDEIKKMGRYDELKEYLDYRMIYVLIQTMSVAALVKREDIFKECKKTLKDFKYRTNVYMKKLLKHEFSKIEYLGMVNILPLNYRISSVMMGVKLKGWK